MLEDSLLRIIRRLDEGGIPYMLLGGFAMAMHGIPRLTQDLDIALGVDVDEMKQLLPRLQSEFKTVVKDPVAFAKDTNVLLLQDIDNGVRVDIIFTFIDFERNAIEQADTMNLNGNEVKVISLDNLVVYKMLAGRSRDKEDVETILAQRPTALDKTSISKNLRVLSDIMQSAAHQEWQALIAEMPCQTIP